MCVRACICGVLAQRVCVDALCRAMFTHCLSDVQLIAQCDRVVLEMAFVQLCQWAVNKLRSCLLDIEQLSAHKVCPAVVVGRTV